MDIAIEPLQPDEIDAFITIYWKAFDPIEANMILPMIYPRGFQPDLKERLRSRVLTLLNEKPNDTVSCAKETSTGEIVGVSWWSHVDSPPQNKDEVDESFQQKKAGRSGGVEVEGMNQDLENAFFRAAFFSEAETMGDKPYMTLKLLAVRPDYARKGVGTLLLRRWLEEVDRLHLPGFIHGGLQAKPLYERHGFQTVGEMPCNALEYGARSNGRHWCMVRPPRSQQTAAE